MQFKDLIVKGRPLVNDLLGCQRRMMYKTEKNNKERQTFCDNVAGVTEGERETLLLFFMIVEIMINDHQRQEKVLLLLLLLFDQKKKKKTKTSVKSERRLD